MPLPVAMPTRGILTFALTNCTRDGTRRSLRQQPGESEDAPKSHSNITEGHPYIRRRALGGLSPAGTWPHLIEPAARQRYDLLDVAAVIDYRMVILDRETSAAN